MIFYDSNGILVDIPDFETEDYLLADRFFERDIRAKLDDFINMDDFLYRTDVMSNRLDIYKIKNTPNRLGTMEKHICGIGIYRNPADGEPCGLCYFNGNEKEFNEDKMFEITYGKGFICMSANDSKYFPEMDKLLKLVVEQYDLKNKKLETIYRDNYILINENKCKFDPQDNFSNYRWNLYTEVKKLCNNANYKNNRINFKLKDGREGHMAIYKGDYDGLFIECMGNFFETSKEALDFFDKYGEFDKQFGNFGENDTFKKYYYDNEPLVAEKVFDRDEYEEDEDEMEIPLPEDWHLYM